MRRTKAHSVPHSRHRGRPDHDSSLSVPRGLAHTAPISRKRLRGSANAGGLRWRGEVGSSACDLEPCDRSHERSRTPLKLSPLCIVLVPILCQATSRRWPRRGPTSPSTRATTARAARRSKRPRACTAPAATRSSRGSSSGASPKSASRGATRRCRPLLVPTLCPHPVRRAAIGEAQYEQ